ncbi:MAG TPA: hypothetical protein VGS08_03530 [Candidatus Saccharimonadales bacterium]|nr:hypothetical protein [Candidatus Saccharimonadales bacterium]
MTLPECGTGTQELVRSYIDIVGNSEPDYGELLRTLDSDHPFYPSMLIGRGCFILDRDGDRSEKQADGYFRKAEGIIEAKLQQAESPCKEGPLSALQHTARILLSRGDPDVLTFLGGDLHQRTVDTTAWLLSEIKDARQRRADDADFLGTLAQQAAIGCYVRRPEMGVLAVQALTHHDRGPYPPQNYDLLTIYHKKTPDGSPGVSSRRLQIKAFCLGLANRHNSKKGKDTRSLFAENITLVSGCCDLRMWQNAPNLVAEHGGELLELRHKDNLDGASARMLAIADGTDTADRNGRMPVRRKKIDRGYLNLIRIIDAKDDTAVETSEEMGTRGAA